MKVKIDYDDIPKGATVSVHGLGELENGQEYELDKDQVEFWKAMNNIGRAPSVLILSTDHQTPIEYDEEPLPETMEPRPVVNEDTTPVDAGKTEKDGK
jgi:hypothetical protein